MQKVLTLTATCLLGILLCASAALADEVRTDHFTLRACLETHLSIMKRFNSMLAMAI